MDEYWQAVVGNDVKRVEALLASDRSLVNSRFEGIAWGPNESPQNIDRIRRHQFSNCALHVAAVRSMPEMIKTLYHFGALPNEIGFEENKGLTPAVVLAAWEGSIETLVAVLDGGADVNLPASAETALYTAAEHGDSAKVELLLERGKHDVFTAAIVGDVEAVKKMIAAYPQLAQARSLKRGRTPREEAEHHGQVEVVRLFD